jgi:hypothetical protein
MLEKLNDIIKDRYGKGFSIQKLTPVDADQDFETHLNKEDLYVPILVKDIFLGYGLVHQAHDLSTEQHQQLSKLIRMVLEPELYSEHLERTLHNLQIEKETTQETEAPVTANGRLIYVYGHSAIRVQKIAMEVHEISQNISYLPIQDVLSSIKNMADLSTLEGSTLVVDLESKLSAQAQDLIQQYLNMKTVGPLLIFTSSRPSYQLTEQGLLSAELQGLLKNHEFSVDRLPVDKQMLRDVLEMMYFRTEE